MARVRANVGTAACVLLLVACGPHDGFDARPLGDAAGDVMDALEAAALPDVARVDASSTPTDVTPVACAPTDAASPAIDASLSSAPIAALSAGAMFTCGLVGDGTARCWGSNLRGQLGDGTTTDRALPVAVAGLANATQLATGGEHACALLGDGSVVCWGSNAFGQLGDGTTVDRASPVTVALPPATRVAAGATWSCALTTMGARCWGDDESGQLADGDITTTSTPIAAASLADATRLALGTVHGCGVFADGSARCWGQGAFGQIGNCATADTRSAAMVTGLATGVIDVGVGLRHGCAVTTDGAVHCWGDDLDGQVGVDPFASDPCRAAMEDGNVHGAVTVPGVTGAVQVALGESSSCALTRDGAAWCWGQNRYGQLGDCTPDARTVVARVAALPAAVQLVAGALHVCARTMDGAAWCFGDNESGQLGDGTTVSRATPVRVLW